MILTDSRRSKLYLLGVQVAAVIQLWSEALLTPQLQSPLDELEFVNESTLDRGKLKVILVWECELELNQSYTPIISSSLND